MLMSISDFCQVLLAVGLPQYQAFIQRYSSCAAAWGNAPSAQALDFLANVSRWAARNAPNWLNTPIQAAFDKDVIAGAKSAFPWPRVETTLGLIGLCMTAVVTPGAAPMQAPAPANTGATPTRLPAHLRAVPDERTYPSDEDLLCPDAD